jgi:hypothetical protein
MTPLLVEPVLDDRLHEEGAQAIGARQREGVKQFWLKLEPIKRTAENCETEHKRANGNREERDERTDD